MILTASAPEDLALRTSGKGVHIISYITKGVGNTRVRIRVRIRVSKYLTST